MISVCLIVFCILCCLSVIHGCQDNCCKCSGYFDCQDYQCIGHNTSTVYSITPVGMYDDLSVFCDFEEDGQGWIVIQRRIDDSVDFIRNWKSYENGFGDITGNYWIGLLPLWRITMQGHYQLRIIIKDWGAKGETKHAMYKYFKIGRPEELYTLQALGYSGTAGDGMWSLRGQKFSTKDQDNDSSADKHCAVHRGGGWWHNACGPSSLNGKWFPYSQRDNPGEGGIRWNPWIDDDYSFKYSLMKIKRA